ncbi:ABC transporter permease [Dongia sp.]|uniref:ABC transporter permease n=1 Tax=Dongia sp. TaxID=1977262 RepID=UPI0035ADB595
METIRKHLNLLSLFAVCYLAFLYVPVLLLPLFSFNDNIYVTLPFKGFTLKWYQNLAANSALQDALWASVKVGIGVAFLSTFLGLLAARAMTRYRLPFRRSIYALIMLPLVIPYMVIGVSTLVILRRGLDLDLSLWTVGASHILITVPLAMLVLMARMEGFDRSLEEASRDLGDSAWRSFRRVTLPLVMPGIVSSLLLCFITSFDEYLLAFFLAGSQSTLPVFIFSSLRFPSKIPDVLALGSLILMVSIVLVVFAEWLRRRGVSGSDSSVI